MTGFLNPFPMTTTLFDLKDRLIWVAGGAGYLGQAVVKALAAAGAQVLCLDLDDKAAAFVSGENLSDRVYPLSCDLNRTDLLPEFVKAQTERFGPPHGLVNLSFGSTAKKLEELSAEDFDRVNHAALTSTFLLAREVSPYMIHNGGGSIVLFASMYGMVSPDGGVYESPMNKNPLEYGVGKAGVIQMTRYLAVHWAQSGVRVNCISPGPFPNPTVQEKHPDFIDRLSGKSPMNRIGVSEEIAGPVLFLLSKASSYVTGHNLVVDGGWTVW